MVMFEHIFNVMFLSTGEFFNLPEHLEIRNSNIPLMVIGVQLIAFVFIAVASMMKSGILTTLVLGNVKVAGIRTYYKESLPMNKVPAIFLLINFAVASTIVAFLLYSLRGYAFDLFSGIVFIPVVLFIWDMAWFYIVPVLTGEDNYFVDVRIMRIFGAHLLGLILWMGSIIIVLYPESRTITIEVMAILCLTELFFRIMRSILAVYRLGASWYYIILYFCTLEILPLFVVSYIILGNFGE